MFLATDLRLASRLLRRSPVFTLTSIVSVSLGIAAAAAIFSITDALLFEPTVGIRQPSAMVDIGRANRGNGFDNMSHPIYAPAAAQPDHDDRRRGFCRRADEPWDGTDERARDRTLCPQTTSTCWEPEPALDGSSAPTKTTHPASMRSLSSATRSGRHAR
jgi:hypothetical protein